MHVFAKALAVAAALFAVPPAAAAEPEPRRERVSPAGLDLASDAGRAAFDRRIRAAAWRVCRLGAADMPSMMRERRCVADARARSAEQVAAIVARRGSLLAAGRGPVIPAGADLAAR